MFEQFIFYFFATLLLLSAIMVITVRNPVHAALFLVVSFFSSAAIWMLMEAEFLAIALVLVYVGAVMVLFLFVIMMLDINLAPLREGFARFLPMGILIAALMAVAVTTVVGSHAVDIHHLSPVAHPQGYSNTLQLGKALFSGFLYPFEVAGAILLLAIVAAISLTMRAGKNIKTPKPEVQVRAKRQDRVRLVKMEAQKSE